MKKLLAVAMSATALVVAGCGSNGGDDTPAVTTDVPPSAQQSASGLTSFVNQLIGTSSDTGEPILLGDAVLPVDDTTETSL